MVESSTHLVREMRETCDVIGKIDRDAVARLGRGFSHRRVLFSGEGSSRIFPSKKVRYDGLAAGYEELIETEGATQALEYDLADYTVLAASNSGRTKEVVRLLRTLRDRGHDDLVLLTAGTETPAEELAHTTFRLVSGAEQAVAATKTVVEQALVYDLAFRARNGVEAPEQARLVDWFAAGLDASVSPGVRKALESAGTIYWAGRNDGVAEELTLKTNEITRKRSDFLEGTYAVHGIEEVMDKTDVVVVIRPFPDEEAKIREVLVEGVGLTVVAVSSEPSMFETIRIPDAGDFAPYVELAAGWNLLVETGTALGIDLDKPERARKVGNEV